MAWGRKIAQALGFAGALGSAEVATAKPNIESTQDIKETTSHREVVSPTATFETARDRVIDLINHGMTDPGSFGEQKGRNWAAVLEGGEGGEPPVVKITVKVGGKEMVQRYATTKAEITSAKSEIQDVYSFATDEEGRVKDVDEMRIEAESKKTVAQARGKKGPGGTSGPIAMEDGE